MAYNSDSVDDMIFTQKKHGYRYTEYNHKNGQCSINTDTLLKILEKQIKEEGMHLVELFVSYDGVFEKTFVKKLIRTNAPNHIIKSICDDIKNDGILNRTNGIDGILGVLKSRGYNYKIIEDIPRFGFTE